MATFQTDVPHRLGRAEAIARLSRLVESALEQYEAHVTDVQGDWQENQLLFSLSASGLSIAGTVTVLETEVRVAGELPLLALPFRGMIEQSISSELARALA
jgi:hypothetical protein